MPATHDDQSVASRKPRRLLTWTPLVTSTRRTRHASGTFRRTLQALQASYRRDPSIRLIATQVIGAELPHCRSSRFGD
ncbi:hypothetical protein TP41_12655 [Xanthomonas euvesicatoria pv. citrumelonis]|nr:hypothetical protein TP41_12655 [Xanthomonas euvesicatoria pv. citrumelonis]